MKKVFSVEHRKNISKAKTGKAGIKRFGKDNPRFGKSHTPETKQKMREARLKNPIKWWSGKKRPTINSGEKSHFYKDGRCNDKNYVSWIKNARNRMKRSNGGSHTFGEWETLKAQYDWTCPCCKRKEPEIKLTEDHIIPVSRGGSDNIENIQPLCQSCNTKKGAKSTNFLKVKM